MIIADASFNSMAGRVKRYMEIEKEVFETTGEHVLYAVNITDSVPKIFENARGSRIRANAIIINYIALVLAVLQAIAEDLKINVPIWDIWMFAGAFYMSLTTA